MKAHATIGRFGRAGPIPGARGHQPSHGATRARDSSGGSVSGRCLRAVLCRARIPPIPCARHRSGGHTSFESPTRWTSGFAQNFSGNEAYWGTIQYADVNGDGKADVCGRGVEGILCARSTGSNFETPALWSSFFSDGNAWNLQPSYWGTIHLVDINADGLADVCGRGTAGIYCALSTGSSFGPATLWTTQFNNAAGWTADQYWKTISWGDLNGDGRADICERGTAGMICAISNGWTFNTSSL